MLVATLGGLSILGAASVSQRTEGPCSSAVNTGKGNVTITCTGIDASYLNKLLTLTKEYHEKMLDTLAKKQLNTEEIQAVIVLRYKAIFASAEEDAERWGKRLDSASDKQSEVDSLAVDGKKLAETISLQWRPVYDYIMKTFDDRVLELDKRGLLKRPDKSDFTPFRKRDLELIAVDRTAQQQFWVRDLRFPNRGLIQILATQAQIHRGTFIRGSRIWFDANVNGVKYDNLMSVYFNREHLSISISGGPGFPSRQLKDRGKAHKWADNEPLNNEEVTHDLSLAIGWALEFVYLNDRSPTKSK